MIMNMKFIQSSSVMGIEYLSSGQCVRPSLTQKTIRKTPMVLARFQAAQLPVRWPSRVHSKFSINGKFPVCAISVN